jgi:hypothetical protein
MGKYNDGALFHDMSKNMEMMLVPTMAFDELSLIIFCRHVIVFHQKSPHNFSKRKSDQKKTVSFLLYSYYYPACSINYKRFEF